MLGLGLFEITVILLLGLLVLGPGPMASLMKSGLKTLNEFKATLNSVKGELKSIERDAVKEVESLKERLSSHDDK